MLSGRSRSPASAAGSALEIPSLLAANSQQTVNQTVSGVRVRSKMVPAVTDVRSPHPEHR